MGSHLGQGFGLVKAVPIIRLTCFWLKTLALLLGAERVFDRSIESHRAWARKGGSSRLHWEIYIRASRFGIFTMTSVSRSSFLLPTVEFGPC